MTSTPEFAGTCRNGHEVRRDLPLIADEISVTHSVSIRCSCGQITECFRSDDNGSAANRTRTRAAVYAEDPFLSENPDFRFGGGARR